MIGCWNETAEMGSLTPIAIPFRYLVNAIPHVYGLLAPEPQSAKPFRNKSLFIQPPLIQGFFNRATG